MPELLFELGCEELPASFVESAFLQLQTTITSLLVLNGLDMGSVTSMGTPRRLIVQVLDLPKTQPDKMKELRGPSVKAAYNESGEPTSALLGFCRGQGVSIEDLRKEGDYVWASVTEKGRPTIELLAEILPDAIKSLTFPKSMRWGSSRMRFARPIRWMLAAFGGELVDFSIEGVSSGLTSVGHRFNDPAPFEATTLEELLRGLRAHQVEPDPKRREQMILDVAARVSSGEPEITHDLLQENVYLTEWPTALQGSFKEEFMELPDPVLVTVMAKHERFFPVRSGNGALMPHFISVRNGGDEQTVRSGNEWVLNARFNDAKFFYDEDQKHSLEQFLEKTEGMTFQDKLGTVNQRAHRLSQLSAEIARWSHAGDHEIGLAERAGLYCKADLSTGLVSELPSLQGVIGAEYARREGFEEAVCQAIASHYDLAGTAPKTEAEHTAMRLLMADQLDKLAGYLGIGLAPSGSSDPFGLRRAAGLLIQAAWLWPTHLPSYLALFDYALARYHAQGLDVDARSAVELIVDIFRSRYESLMPLVRHDVREAATSDDDPGVLLSPRLVSTRVRALEILSADETFVQTATRPINIVAAALKKKIVISTVLPEPASLQSVEGEALLVAGREAMGPITRAAVGEDPEGLVEALRPLQHPINSFFDTTMVMVEDQDVRDARLSMLDYISSLLRYAGDFTKLVFDASTEKRG